MGLTALQSSKTRDLIKGLSADQLKAATYLALPRKARPRKQDICKELEISPTTLWNWQQKAEFETVRAELVRSYFSDFVPDVVQAMHDKAVTEGDVSAARLFLEFVRELDGGNINFTQNVYKLKDSEVSERIDELERKFGAIDAEATEKTNDDEEKESE